MNTQESSDLFYCTYGFTRGALQKPSLYAKLVQKAVCDKLNIEIYKLGSVMTQAILFADIYILNWEDRVIPFLVDNRPVHITEKEFIRTQRDNWGREKIIAQYKIPIVSVLISDVGKDLKEWPNGREEHADYDRDCFAQEDHHSYSFKNEHEYLCAIEYIKKGLTILFFDQYKNYSFDPFIVGEYVSGVGPWNLRENLLKEESDAHRNQYGSIYRKIHAVQLRLRKAVGTKMTIKYNEKAKKNPFNRLIPPHGINNIHLVTYDRANKITQCWMTEFRASIKSVKDFLKFLDTHPKKREINGVMVRMGDLMQDNENRDVFYAKLVDSKHFILDKFAKFKSILDQRIRKAVDHYSLKIKDAPPKYDSLDMYICNKFKESIPNKTIEYIMKVLIENELPFHYHGTIMREGWLNHILRHSAFITTVKASYNRHYTMLYPNYEYLLLSISETIIRREQKVIARELADRQLQNKKYL